MPQTYAKLSKQSPVSSIIIIIIIITIRLCHSDDLAWYPYRISSNFLHLLPRSQSFQCQSPLSTNLILGLPRFCFPKTIPLIRSHPSPLFLITWPTNESFRLLISCSRHGFCPSLPTTHSFVCISTHLM